MSDSSKLEMLQAGDIWRRLIMFLDRWAILHVLVLSCAAMQAGVAYPLRDCDGVVERVDVGPRMKLLFSLTTAKSLRAPSACRHHTGQIVTE